MKHRIFSCLCACYLRSFKWELNKLLDINISETPCIFIGIEIKVTTDLMKCLHKYTMYSKLNLA